MEKFKAVEKEMKTKAYSKEGLLASTKMDPKEKERAQVREFLTNAVSDLELQIETCEAEAEGLQVTLKKGRKDASKADRVAEVERIVDRHKWHIQKLELILRLLENGQLEVEAVAKIQDDIRYYIDSNREVDFTEDDAIYDDLNLDEEQEDLYGIGLDDKMSSQDTQSVQDDVSDKPINCKDPSSNASSARRPSTQLRSPMPALATLHNPSSSTVPIPPLPGSGSSMKPAPIPTRPAGETLKYASAAAAAAATDRNVGIAPLPPPPGITASSLPINPLPSPNAPRQLSQKLVNSSTTPAASSNPSTPLLHKAELVTENSTAPSPQPRSAVPIVKEQAERNKTPDQVPRSSSSGSIPASNEDSPNPSLLQPPAPALTHQQPSTESSPTSSPTSAPSQSGLSGFHISSSSQPHLNGTNSLSSMPPPCQQPEVQSPVSTQQQSQVPLVQRPTPPPGLVPNLRDAAQSCIYNLPPGLRDLISSFESTRQRITNPLPHANSPARLSGILVSTLVNTPDTVDAEKPKHYKPVTKYHSPPYYPQDVLPIFDDPKLYQRIDTDTLFYIFYYKQGTYQQYLAAKELKRQSWRFHKMYQTWFQRHEEPKTITDEYEQGTYRFFDYESTWMNRRKTEFK